MKLPIILIGPMYTGKSTLASILSKKISIPEVPVDYIAGYYYVKSGINLLELEQVMKTGTIIDYVRYMRNYELEAAISICNEFSSAIISFGGGHAYFEEESQIKRLLSLRNLTDNIFLILPSENNQVSEIILNGRIDKDEKNKSPEKIAARKQMNKDFIESQSMRRFATNVIYTDQKSPEDCCEEIIKLIK